MYVFAKQKARLCVKQKALCVKRNVGQVRALAVAEDTRVRLQEEYDAYKRQMTRHLSELSERNGEMQRSMSNRLSAEQVCLPKP